MSNALNGATSNAAGPIAIVGSGAWGTTLARMVANAGVPVTLVTRTAERASELSAHRENTVFLPGFEIPDSVTITDDTVIATADAAIVFVVVPSQQVRGVAESLRSTVNDECIIVTCAKGFESGTLRRMSEVIVETVALSSDRVCAMSGPNLAREIASGLPASTVVASSSNWAATAVQTAISSPSFRVYTSDDVVGVEFGGALKNVVALAAGALDGMGAGHNTKAALICRGLAEITRLGVAAGANPFTFVGLSGLGDLIATCESPLSRNRTFGERLGRGIPANEAMGNSPHVVEGLTATAAAVTLSDRFSVEMPIARAVDDVLNGRATVREALNQLMLRAYRGELDEPPRP